MEALLKLKEDANNLYTKSYLDLETKKDKQFKLGLQDFTKLGISPETVGILKEDLLQNPIITKQLIFKDVDAFHPRKPNSFMPLETFRVS